MLRAMTWACVLLAFLLAAMDVFRPWEHNVASREKLAWAIEHGLYNDAAHMLANYAIIAAYFGSLYGGALYLPFVWFTQRHIGSAVSQVPRGERLWFAAGSGALTGKVLEWTAMPHSPLAVAIIPATFVLAVLWFSAVWPPRPPVRPGWRWHNLIGWIVSLPFALLMIFGSVIEIYMAAIGKGRF